MKLNYSEEDRRYLATALHFASTVTERIFEPHYIKLGGDELKLYVLGLISIRKKIYEFLEESDPNQAHVDSILEILAHQQVDEVLEGLQHE